MSLVAELKRRNVFRVAAAYLVAGWLATEVLTTVLPTVGAPDWVSRAVVLVFALGFLPAIAFAWVYEVTPEGIKKQHEVDIDQSLASSSGRRLEYMTFAAVIVGVLFLAVFGSRNASDEASIGALAVAENSVAVLPFVNLSNNPDNEYFSDGLTETLLHMLAQVPELKVAARTSSFAFKNQNRPISEIAAALGVAHVLEGSVQRDGDRVRITAQLIRASDSFHVWSESYDRTLDNIFAIQDDIAAEVGTALSRSILGRTLPGSPVALNTESTDAYDLYLQALQERSTFSFWGLRAEEDLLKGALTIDPDFTDAKTALAYNYLSQANTGLLDESLAEREVLALTEQVLELRPHDVDALAIRLFLRFPSRTGSVSPGQLENTVTDLRSLVAEHPEKLQARMLLARLLTNFHRIEEAKAVFEQALELDPLNPRILFELGSLHAGLKQYDEARRVLQKSLKIEPRQPNAYAVLSRIDLIAGDGVAFVRNLLRAIEVDPADHELSGALAAFLYHLGLLDEADDLRNRVRSIAPTSPAAYRLEMLRAIALGDDIALSDIARRALENDISDRGGVFGAAVRELLRLAILEGTVDEALEFIAGEAPGIFDIEAEALPLKYRSAQFAAMDAWRAGLSHEALQERLEQLLTVAHAFGINIADKPETYFQVLALRGESEAAIELAVNEILADSALQHPGWRRTLELESYAEIVADERIQAGLRRWEEEEACVRERVRNYLGDLRAST